MNRFAGPVFALTAFVLIQSLLPLPKILAIVENPERYLLVFTVFLFVLCIKLVVIFKFMTKKDWMTDQRAQATGITVLQLIAAIFLLYPINLYMIGIFFYIELMYAIFGCVMCLRSKNRWFLFLFLESTLLSLWLGLFYESTSVSGGIL